MSRYPFLNILKNHAFPIVLTLAVLLVVSKAVVAGLGMHETFATKGNDNVMRLLTVRDWLAGQRWYDVAQYRLMPPEGVSLHWSRYVDAGIAAIVVPFSWFLPMTSAEMVAITLWPTLILILSLVLIGFGTLRIFGAMAACFAVLCAVLWPVTSSMHSSAGSLDHHNIQMLLMTLMSLALVWPSRPNFAGIICGVAAALSLAIGLEGFVFIVGIGFLNMVRTGMNANSDNRKFLVSFCVMLMMGSVLLWLGQTGPAARLELMCDQLGPPALTLVGVASVACFVLLIVSDYTQSVVVRLGAAALVVFVGLMLVSPFLSHCLAGPYAQIPPELQKLITSQIIEAKPLLVYVRTNTVAALVFCLPVVVALFVGAAVWFSHDKLESAEMKAHAALGLLIVLGFIGLPVMLVQMRAVVIPASVIPIVGGVVVARLVQSYLRSRSLNDGLIALLVATTVVSPTVVVQSLKPILPAREASSEAERGDCRSYASLLTLNEASPAIILNHVNFGPALIWATHHSVLSAPYHRSTEAFMNGIVPFQLDQGAFKSYVTETKATHLLLCRGLHYQSEYVRGLANGDEAEWLRRVPVSNEDQLLFEILR
ncbi:hypothetical protein CLV80_105129 [Yoonia maritima]|uniref:Uncharacterized protein n=1 Tax=Yoonia maritima TaxID=1435347 RepID=A0A2T0VZA8_9RHOB|nr:hypothetical protein [Yoonia maritima]PRY77646.1 hypothetical protein CLV80_105129 [Yoonia maritima]